MGMRCEFLFLLAFPYLPYLPIPPLKIIRAHSRDSREGLIDRTIAGRRVAS